MTGPGSYPNPLLARRHWPVGVPRPNLWYRFMRRFFQVGFSAGWQVRVFGRRHEPAQGSVVYVSNHQSFLDPILSSLALRRPVSYMARDDLFRFPVFRQVIRSLNAFAVRRGTADTGAIKEAMRRLKAGGQVVVFAEGTRTADGRIGPLLPGVALLIQRAADWTVPVVIDGAYECWPRRDLLPRPGSIVVQYAPALARARAAAMTPQELLDGIRRTLIRVQAEVRRRVGRPPIVYPPRRSPCPSTVASPRPAGPTGGD